MTKSKLECTLLHHLHVFEPYNYLILVLDYFNISLSASLQKILLNEFDA